jgi:molybdate transport system substrate-binding protein
MSDRIEGRFHQEKRSLSTGETLVNLRILSLGLILFFQVFTNTVAAEEVRVAVASNFLSTMKILTSNFEYNTTHRIIIISGSSGKLYAQIHHGAPFDVFFSADQHRPGLLEKEGAAIKGSRFPYAVGRLTLWSPETNFIHTDGKTALTHQSFAHLAIANPKTAPYGRAAEQTLRSLGLWERIKHLLVYGENIAQTFQFVSSQNAELGFVAHSQVLGSNIQQLGSRWDVPPTLHDPVIQEAVLLNQGATNAAARAFLEYVKTPSAQAIIRQHGYRLPDQE